MKTITINADLIPTVIGALISQRNGLQKHLNSVPKGNDSLLIQRDIDEINSVFDFLNSKLKTNY